MPAPNLLQQISQAALEASPALERVGHWMAAHPLRVISMSADEVAHHSGASLAAVNRFARSAGFDGFSHLKSALSEELHDASEPIRKLQPAAQRKAEGAAEAHPLGLAQHNLRMASQALDEVLLDKAARRLLKSHKVYMLGLGISSALSAAAAHLLLPYLQGIVQVAGEGGTEVAARRMMRIGPQDALLAISVPRYSRDTAVLAQYARERGAYVVAITDRPGAPLAAQADAVLLAPAAHDVLSSSVVAAMAMVESLTARVVQLNPDSARLVTELSEAVLDHLSVGKSKQHL